MTLIPSSVTRNIGTNIFQLKKQSPHIFFIGGVLGVTASTILACRSTLRLSEVLDDFNKDINETKEIKDQRSEREYFLDIIHVYGKGTFAIVKLYGTAIVIGAVSVSALTGSHVSLSRRNAGLTAALATVTKAYEDYRERVREEVGKEQEYNLYLGAKDQVLLDDEGNKEVVKLVDPNKLSAYARFFDEASPNWEKNSELNRLYVQCQQNYANHRLQAKGHVFLNEVYDMLGIERSSAGQVVGWLVNGDGDNHIDFGMFDAVNRDFVNGWERSILLDFNVDGVIYDKI